VFAAILATPVVITSLVLPVGVVVVTVVDPAIVPETAMVPAAVNKPDGKLMVKVVPMADGLTVPVLNATVKALAVAGKVWAIVKVTPEIWPEIAGAETPADTRSTELETVTLPGFAACAAPVDHALLKTTVT